MMVEADACLANTVLANDSPAPASLLGIAFTGSGREYFRIWVVNLLLTLATAGIYSAWAKVRRLPYLGWPAMYAWMKHYQYGHAWYGDRPSRNAPAVFAFAGIYVRGLLLATSVVIVVSLVGIIAMPLGAVLPAESAAVVAGAAIAAAAALMGYVLLGPYQQVRVMNLCLENTSFPGLRFVSTLSARGYARLQVKNLLLTLLTLGLYRPFAVVSAYRYRLAHLALAVDEGFDHVVSRVTAGGGAAGDGAADFVGFDLSW